jgi:hypothetical protein
VGDNFYYWDIDVLKAFKTAMKSEGMPSIMAFVFSVIFRFYLIRRREGENFLVSTSTPFAPVNDRALSERCENMKAG